MQRTNNRPFDHIRPIKIYRQFTKYAEGSILITLGETKVLCNASVIKEVPRFLKDKGQGWLTAEYGMLPRATHTRMNREAANGKQSGRTQEIQRLIGRALRAGIDLTEFPNHTIKIDCDVIQADGGTRTAAITAASLALKDAINYMHLKGIITSKNTIAKNIAAISVGICNDMAILDLDYQEDSSAETDMNVVMTDGGDIIEIQGTAEGKVFTETQLYQMLSLAKKGIQDIFDQTNSIINA